MCIESWTKALLSEWEWREKILTIKRETSLNLNEVEHFGIHLHKMNETFAWTEILKFFKVEIANSLLL